MKKVLSIAAIASITSFSYASGGPSTSVDDLRAELEQLKQQVAELKEAQEKINLKALKRQIREIKAHDAGDNIKWHVDFRTAYDVVGYKIQNGTDSWNGVFSNRLWLGMGFAPTQHIVFKGLISYYKAYGQMTGPAAGNQGSGFNYFDWIVNETPNPAGELRVKEAYWLYLGDSFLGTNIPWTASLGRRPATDGLLVSYREDQDPKSPLGHIINTEFDGASFKFNLENVTHVPGMYFKLCMGRGLTNANIRYATQPQGAQYTKVPNWNNTDLAGFIFVPYDDGQYSVHTTAFKAWNLPGMVARTYNLQQVGDMYGAAVSFLAQGIGDGISDFLDDTNAFISFAWSQTDPTNGNSMLGATDSKNGTSVYVGANWPCQLLSDARAGIEYNHGSKYWRSFTYAEDTLAGSKLAARGDAYEVWLTKNLIGKTLTAQLRYTYIDYDYTGSQGFFGKAGAPYKITSLPNKQQAVDTAQDLRLYIRYRY